MRILTALIVLLATVAMAQTTYQLDLAHSSVVFAANHAGVGYTFGRFDEMDGTLEYDAANPENSSLVFTIITESVNTNNADRDDHLRSGDFFNASQFPTIDFTSTGISQVGDSNFEVTGELSMHGETETITFPVQITGTGTNRQGNAIIGFYSDFEVDRTDFGMTNLRQADGGPVNDMIRLIVSLEAVAQ